MNNSIKVVLKKFSFILLLVSVLVCCTPKGPQTFPSKFIGKTKTELIATKGPAQRVKVFDQSEALIYVQREEYFGNVKKGEIPSEPKRVYEIEYIYYINSQNIVYKYQVWKKRID